MEEMTENCRPSVTGCIQSKKSPVVESDTKTPNPIYNTFRGGGTSGTTTDADGNDHSVFDRYFCWGHLRMTKNFHMLKVRGTYYSLHCYGKHTKHLHLAFIRKFPFVLFSFDKIKDYIDHRPRGRFLSDEEAREIGLIFDDKN